MATQELSTIRIDNNFAFITLGRGYEAIVDLEDVSTVAGFNWWANVHARNIYATTAVRSIASGPTSIYMHRLIMNAPDDMQVDHISGNGLDNRRQNLRLCTISQNRFNQRKSIRNTSGFKGVSFHAQSGKWRAMIGYKKKMKHIGLFDTPEDAHAAYCSTAKDLYGNFSRSE